MTRRREIMRAAGWTAIIGGLAAMAAAILTQSEGIDLLGGYGVLIALTGGWTVVGLKVLTYREQAAAGRRVAARARPQRGVNLG
jgi:hypothetical protein